MKLKAIKLVVPLAALTMAPQVWSQSTNTDRPWNESPTTSRSSQSSQDQNRTSTSDKDVNKDAAKDANKQDKKAEDVSKRFDNATKTLQEITSNEKGKGIPASELSEARCIGVVPKETEVAVIAGAKHGNGVVTCKDAQGMWSAPAFFSMTGGTFGAQAGVERKDIVLLGMTEKAKDAFFQKDFDLGATAEATGGKNSASADVHSQDFMVYTMANGVFAGLNVNGTVLHRDDDAIQAVYGKNEKAEGILGGKVQPPAQAKQFMTQVQQLQTRRG